MGFIDRMLTDPGVRARREEFAWRQDYRDMKADQRESRRERQRELDRQQRADAAAVTQRQRENAALVKQYQDQEKAFFGQPRTDYTGGNNANRKPLRVTHHSAPLPLAYLAHPEAPDKAVTFGPGFMRSRNGSLTSNPEWAQQAHETLEVWTKVKGRYATTLAKLRDDAWWTQLATAAGLTHSTTVDEPWAGDYATGTRKVTTVTVPTIGKVQVAEDGLRITIQLDVHVPPKKWAAATDVLRAGFKGVGMNAGNLRVTETASGAPLLVFDDAPSSFPLAVCPSPPSSTVTSVTESIARYERTRWMIGVDSRGKTISYPLKSQPHVLVTGGTGGGKSVWARSVIESLRTGYKDENGHDAGGGWLCWIGDGKGSDFAALEGQPGIAMVTPGSTDPAQVAVMVRRVRMEVERRFEVAGAAKKRGDTAAFAGMQPWLLLLDEWGATAIKMVAQFGKSALAFLSDIDIILRLGRECRVHCVLLSQTIRKTGDGAVPGSWQENLGLTISLGCPSDITLQSDAFTPETRDRAALIGSRLKGKRGRGLTADRETSAVIEFQSFYGWSPGTTSLDPAAEKDVSPPTPEVRELWTQWKPISAAVPWLAPRVGIKVTDAEWRGDEKADLNDVANTPTIPLTDRDGHLRPGMERYDPASDQWLGKKRIGGAGGVYTPISFDGDPAPAAPAPSPAPAESPTEPAAGNGASPVAGMTDAERKEAVRQEAIRMGLIPPDEQPIGESPDPPTAGTPREPLGDADAPTQPDTDNEPSTPTAQKPRKPRRGFE